MEIKQIDLSNPIDCKGLLSMMSAYAQHPMGGGEDLSDEVKKVLIPQLQKQTNYIGFLIWQDDKAIGIANCFSAFSTFKAQPLINIHDFAIDSTYQSMGLGNKLMQHIQKFAKDQGYCKITLEVLSSNDPARALYKKYDFGPYELANDVAEFWQHHIK